MTTTPRRGRRPAAGTPAPETRSLSVIAREIRQDWASAVNYGALPYLDAMSGMDKITDRYGLESAESVVLYFLSNASTWKGETARRVKAELRALVAAPRVTKPCNICRVVRVPAGVHACELCE